MKRLVRLSIVACFLLSCESEEINLVIDDELQPYIDLFVEEASMRGLEIRIEDELFTASIRSINRPNVAGQCTHGEGTVSQVLIDEDAWRRYDDQEKESLVFHELGHCILKRAHRDHQDAEGNCLSLMESGTSGCKLEYSTQTRERLLDELFE